MSIANAALGGNIGESPVEIVAVLLKAVELTQRHAEVWSVKVTKWYKTPAFPPGSGPDFVNGACQIETGLSPYALLQLFHDVELELGRERPARWAPRVCDLDLLSFDDLILPDRGTLSDWMALDRGKAQTLIPPRLILPHPRMQERAFVLVPLAEIAPDWCHPLTGRTVIEMRDALGPEALAEVRPLE